MSRIHTILASIAEDIKDEMHDNTRDEREDRLIQELDNSIIYYATQWDILNEARPSTFELEQLGELAQSPAELAFDILYSTFINEYWGALEDVEEVPEETDINKETNPEGYYRDRLKLIDQLPKEMTEKDFRSSQYDQLIDEGLVPIDHVTDRLAPRTCSVTGKGMHSGWCWGNGDFYTSTQRITFEELEKNRQDILESLVFNGYSPTVGDPDDPEFFAVARKVRNDLHLHISTKELLTLAYGLGILYWTEWETEE